jgi:hypothetical protein
MHSAKDMVGAPPALPAAQPKGSIPATIKLR